MAIKSDHTGIFQFHGFRYIRKILKKLSLFTPYYGIQILFIFMEKMGCSIIAPQNLYFFKLIIS